MSFSSTSRQLKTPARVIRRYVSSTPEPKSHRTLPSAKMRALISLYHQADTCITPENLSKRIEEAFLPERPYDRLYLASTVRDLKYALKEQRSSPKLSEWNEDSSFSPRRGRRDDVSWSSLRAERELKVIEALYGVDATHPRHVLPGLEVLEESKESLDGNRTDDLETLEEGYSEHHPELEKVERESLGSR